MTASSGSESTIVPGESKASAGGEATGDRADAGTAAAFGVAAPAGLFRARRYRPFANGQHSLAMKKVAGKGREKDVRKLAKDGGVDGPGGQPHPP